MRGSTITINRHHSYAAHQISSWSWYHMIYHHNIQQNPWTSVLMSSRISFLHADVYPNENTPIMICDNYKKSSTWMFGDCKPFFLHPQRSPTTLLALSRSSTHLSLCSENLCSSALLSMIYSVLVTLIIKIMRIMKITIMTNENSYNNYLLSIVGCRQQLPRAVLPSWPQ